MKADVRKLGRGFLTKKIKKMNKVIERKNSEIAALEAKNNFQYQLEVEYPRHCVTIKKCLRKLDEYLASEKMVHHPEKVQILNPEVVKSSA
jgi:hypothetical protein